MSVQMVTFRTTREHAADVEAGIRRMMAAVRRARPEGTRFAYCRLPDGLTFVALLELDEGVENPLPGIPEAREYRERLAAWTADDPAPRDLEVIAAHGLFEAAVPATA